MDKLTPNVKLDIENILKDLESYRPKRRGWVWRESASGEKQGPFVFLDASKPLEKSIPLPSAKYFDNIDPQPMPVSAAMARSSSSVHSSALGTRGEWMSHTPGPSWRSKPWAATAGRMSMREREASMEVTSASRWSTASMTTSNSE